MRTQFLVAMLIGAALSSCAETVTDIEESEPTEPEKPILERAAADALALGDDVRLVRADDDGSCEPMSPEGPCELICDPDLMLEMFVPEGTCAHFLCTARDGTKYRLGGCR